MVVIIIFNGLQLVCIVSNFSVSYFATVDISSWCGLSECLISEVMGVFSPGVLVVFQFYLVSMMTEVMEIYLGKNVGLDFDHFF